MLSKILGAALDRIGFTVLNAEDIVSKKINMNGYKKFV